MSSDEKWERIREIGDTADPPASPMHQSVKMKLPDGTATERTIAAPLQETFPERLVVEVPDGGVVGDPLKCSLALALGNHFGGGYVAIVIDQCYLNVYRRSNVMPLGVDGLSVAGRRPVATYGMTATFAPIAEKFADSVGGRVALRRAPFSAIVRSDYPNNPDDTPPELEVEFVVPQGAVEKVSS